MTEFMPHIDVPPSDTHATSSISLDNHFRAALLSLSAFFSIPESEIGAILDSGCICVGDVDIVVCFNEAYQFIEFYADGGVPRQCDQLDVYRTILEAAFMQGAPTVWFGLHPDSHHIVARACIHVTMFDEGYSILELLITAALEKIAALHQVFPCDSS